MTQKQMDEFKKLAEPLIKYLCENHNPHTTIIIDSVHAELLSGEMVFNCKTHILD